MHQSPGYFSNRNSSLGITSVRSVHPSFHSFSFLSHGNSLLGGQAVSHQPLCRLLDFFLIFFRWSSFARRSYWILLWLEKTFILVFVTHQFSSLLCFIAALIAGCTLFGTILYQYLGGTGLKMDNCLWFVLGGWKSGCNIKNI